MPGNPLVEQFRKGKVPLELRLMAAQGALPLTTTDLLDLLLLLLGDAEEKVREAAGGTLEGVPAAELLAILKDKTTPPPVLGWAIAHRSERELREVALQNPTARDEDIEAVVASLPEHLAELVVINQVRLLRRTSLLEALESNKDLSNDQRRRLRELRETFKIGQQEAPPPPPPPPEPPPVPAAEAEEEPEPVEEVMSEEEALMRYLTDDEQQQTERVSVAKKLIALNTAGKVIAALKGSREERAILIRDPNRLVASAVLGSPRLTEAEVDSFAAMKNVSDQVLREIGTNKEWTKRYSVVSNLVRNPRTPLAISIGMVSRLNPRDLKLVSVDRNVPEPIRKQAQRFVKTQQPGR